MSTDIALYKLRNERIVKLFNNLCHPVFSESNCRNIVEKWQMVKCKELEKCSKTKKIFIVIFIVITKARSTKKSVNMLVGDIDLFKKTCMVHNSVLGAVKTLNYS